MNAINAWVSGNFKYAIIIGIVGVIVGGAVAFKADNKAGYFVMGFGLLFIIYTLRVWGLF